MTAIPFSKKYINDCNSETVALVANSMLTINMYSQSVNSHINLIKYISPSQNFRQYFQQQLLIQRTGDVQMDYSKKDVLTVYDIIA